MGKLVKYGTKRNPLGIEGMLSEYKKGDEYPFYINGYATKSAFVEVTPADFDTKEILRHLASQGGLGHKEFEILFGITKKSLTDFSDDEVVKDCKRRFGEEANMIEIIKVKNKEYTV